MLHQHDRQCARQRVLTLGTHLLLGRRIAVDILLLGGALACSWSRLGGWFAVPVDVRLGALLARLLRGGGNSRAVRDLVLDPTPSVASRAMVAHASKFSELLEVNLRVLAVLREGAARVCEDHTSGGPDLSDCMAHTRSLISRLVKGEASPVGEDAAFSTSDMIEKARMERCEEAQKGFDSHSAVAKLSSVCECGRRGIRQGDKVALCMQPTPLVQKCPWQTDQGEGECVRMTSSDKRYLQPTRLRSYNSTNCEHN